MTNFLVDSDKKLLNLASKLKDVDETQNVSRLAKTYANTYVDAAENLNR